MIERSLSGHDIRDCCSMKHGIIVLDPNMARLIWANPAMSLEQSRVTCKQMVTADVHVAHTMTLLDPLEYKEYTIPCRLTTSNSALIAEMSWPLSIGVRPNSSRALLLIYLHHPEIRLDIHWM